MGTRGTGALEYEPTTGPDPTGSRRLEVQALVDLASRILSKREGVAVSMGSGADEEALTELLRVGTSAGGARAKALIAWNRDTNEVRSDKRGQWSLSPAFDVIYAYNPSGDWTASHQMTVNGKRDGFTLEDLDAVGRTAFMKRGRAAAISEEVRSAASAWTSFADQAGVDEGRSEKIRKALRIDLPTG